MERNKTLILKNIKRHLGYKKDVDFANFLGISPQTLASWYTRNTFDLEVLYAKCVDIDANFLLTGRGEMLRNTTSSLQEPTPIYIKSETCEKCAEKEKLIKAMQGTIDTQKELIDCLQTLKKNCKQQEKKKQIDSDFPNLSANIQ